MPNSIKYSATAQTLALKKGDFWIGTNDVGKGPTSTSGYWNGISPPRGGYTIYLNKSSNGPSIYVPSNDTQLIDLTNKIAGTNYTTANECLNYYISQTDKFLLDKDYDAVITNGLVYLADSSCVSSYPKNGSSLYPLMNSGSVGNGTLSNGTSWNSTTGTFSFDGTDDLISIANSNNFNNITWSAGITIAVWYKIDALTDFNSQFRCMIGVAGSGRSFNFYLYSPTNNPSQLYYHFSSNYAGGVSNAVTVSTTRYHLGVITITPQAQIYYHDAISAGSFAGGTPYYDTIGGTQYLGRGDNMWKGNIYRWAIYNRALSQTEITRTLRNSGPSFFNTCKTCKDIIDTFPQLAGYDGLYWVYPEGSNSSPYQVYCDMTTDGGGWMLIARSHPTTYNPNGKKWGWKGGSIGSINDFSQAYQLGWGEIWDGNTTFTSYIFGNQRGNFDNSWGPFIYKIASINYSTFFGSDTQQSYTTSTIKSNTSVYGSSSFPGMQGAIGYTTTGTNDGIYYMRDCCGYSSSYGGIPTQFVSSYCGANFYYSGAWCGGSSNTGGIYDYNSYVSNGLTYGGTNQYMIMVK
jgi:hypothetical protein